MNKINSIILIIPLIINIRILFFIIIPSKINKINPITLIIILILITFLICLKINFFKKSLIPFILFLIIIGGLIVIYMYITSLSNNEFLSFNFKILLINLIKFIPLFIIFLFLINQFYQLILNNNNLINLNPEIDLFNKNNIYLNIIYKENNNKSSYYIILYLYYSIICIINICFKLKSPLRQLSF